VYHLLNTTIWHVAHAIENDVGETTNDSINPNVALKNAKNIVTV
jgi:hypothetical protein